MPPTRGIRRSFLPAAALCAVAMLSAPRSAPADGKGFPLAAHPRTPEIPAQRALITFRDGTETLIVETTFDTDSPEVGWVLPLPAEPTDLRAFEPGLLTSLTMSLRPRIVTGGDDSIGLLAWLVLAMLPVPALQALSRRLTARGIRPISVLVVYLILLLLVTMLLMPASSGHLGAAGDLQPGLALLQTRRVGGYDVSVLRAESPEVLSTWLADNGFQTLGPDEQAIVADYIARKWCFVVAKLRTDGDGPHTPHPISATFPIDTPVYPMKLTAAAGSTLSVDLFILADARASADGFTCVASDTFGPAPAARLTDNASPFLVGASTDLVIGSPDVVQTAWDGCVVTRLSRTMAPADMTEDIPIRLGGTAASRQTFHTETARAHRTLAILLAGMLAIFITLCIVLRGARRPGRAGLLMLLAIALATLAAAFVFSTMTPTVDDQQVVLRYPFGFKHFLYTARRAIDGVRPV